MHLKAHAMATNKTPSGTYRGPGRFEGCFFMDRLIDMAATDLGLDRLDIRRRNLIALAEMPYPLAPVRPNDGFGDTACDSGDYAIDVRPLRRGGGLERQGSRLNGKLIDGRYHGLGIACFIEGGGVGPARERAHRGRARRHVRGLCRLVGGRAGRSRPIMAQIAADALEVPIERIKVYHGSTTYLPEGFGSYGSRATVMGGSAIVLDGQCAARQNSAPPPASSLASRPTTSTWRRASPSRRTAAASRWRSLRALSVDGEFDNSKATYTYGTAIAHVAVDPAHRRASRCSTTSWSTTSAASSIRRPCTAR